MSMERWWNADGKTEILWEKSVTVPCLSTKIPYGLAWDWTLNVFNERPHICCCFQPKDL